MQKGIAGKIASMFLTSKLSLLLMIALLIVGLYSASLIPREEEPQIDVPMVDIMIGYPGASPKEVERRVVEPLEKIFSNIKGVEHLHSTADNGQAMIIVQFYVGEDIERSYVKLYDELFKNMDKMPDGVHPPLVKTRSIDDVPMLGLTFWSEEYNDFELRQLTEEVAGDIKKIKDVSQINIIGGRTREVKVVVDKDKMAQNEVDALSIMEIIKAANKSMQSGSFVQNNQEYLITTGEFLSKKEDVENLIVGVSNNMPVYLRQVAEVKDGPATNVDYVSFGYSQFNENYSAHPSEYNAVTLSIGKVQGADAMKISDEIIAKVDDLEKNMIPSSVHVEVTRNYGETASEKVTELFSSLFIAIMVVTGLVMLAMGWRGGLVVFLSVPLTFALTLASYYLLGYTLNRITLFALVFVVGIVVDDSIIIAENMHRHFKMRRLPFKDAALYAINEVGNPTILATFIVIASIFPMAFVSGMMGPYMSPMPIGASIAMMLSLLVALTITPYLGYHLLREKDKQEDKEETENNSRVYRLFDKHLRPLLISPKRRTVMFVGVILFLLGTLSLFYTKSVAVKMLPFDNKNEFQVVIDMPEGSTLEKTSAATREIAHYLSTVSEVVNYQSYVGASAPITFNGLVRHYDLRGGSHMADIQVNLLSKDDRKLQSHDIAKKIRPGVQEIANKHGANVKIVEVPPGPPVLSTLVAEIYGPDYEQQIKVAQEVKTILENTEDVVDIDWSVEAEQTEYRLAVDREKAMLNGIVPEQIVGNMTYLLREQPLSNLYDENSAEGVGIVMALDDADKSSIEDLLNLNIKSQQGKMIPVGDLVKVNKSVLEKSISRKDQQRVVYVLADMAGELESPAYAILGMEKKLKEQIDLPAGYSIGDLYMGQPEDESNFTVKWDGEWQITLEVFKDLGIAFMVVIIVIYMLIVGWFQNFVTPIVMMAAIPLSLIGIILGHWILGAFFTATSFIGMIALVGIMVRNSVLIIDFIEIRLNEGVPIKQSIIDAVAVRTIPILLTAGTVVIGAVVILFDPIFQGLAISLVGGAIVSTLLTLFLVPTIYYLVERKRWKHLEK